jgi:hypothetical protein
MHKRDNRRTFPSHFDSVRPADERDPREIRWVRNGSNQQVLEIDGRNVAEVFAFGQPRYDLLGEWVHPHNARILGSTAVVEFNTLDAARLYCERQFARAA